MAYFVDKSQFDCIEVFREMLFKQNPDVAEKCTYGVPLLQTLGEVCALIGLPVDLKLSHIELVAFIWDLCEILRRRGAIMIVGGTESIMESILEVQGDLLSEVMQEFATGIVVTQDEIVVADAEGAEGDADADATPKQLELLPGTLQKLHKQQIH